MHWIELLISSILGAILGLIVWFIQSRIGRIKREQEKLHDERRKIYSGILEPYIKLFSQSTSDKKMQKVALQMGSFEYRKKAFEFTLIGDDSVVHAFNNSMQYVFKADEKNRQVEAKEMMRLWGNFLLEIRRNVNDPNTSLNNKDMLKGIITDIDMIL